IINDQKSRKQTKVSGLIGEALLTEKNDSKQALPIIEKALQILPNDPNALQTRHDIWSDNEFYDLVLPHPHPVEAVRIAPNDSIILTAAENVIYQWAKTSDLLGRIKHNTPITDLCYSKDGQSILFGTQGNTAELYTSDGRKINSFPHPDWVNAVAFSPNNQSILTAGRDGIARVFDLSGELLLELTGHQASLTDIAFSKNGDKILTTSADGLLLIWNQEGTILDRLEKQASKVLSGTFARTSNQILSSNRSGVATIWNTDGTIAARLKGHEKAINTAQFLKQDRYVLTASNDDQIKLWDHMGNVLKTYKGHRNDVSDLTVSNTGHWFTSAGADSTARIWRLTSKVTHSFGQHENEVAAMAVSKDGNYILTASGGGVQAELDDVNDLATDNFDDLMFLLEATNPQSAYLWNKEGKGTAEL
ncbi:MAG: WD40 repeat domain-containing protein, partial [Bacteroidota bacterium]